MHSPFPSHPSHRRWCGCKQTNKRRQSHRSRCKPRRTSKRCTRTCCTRPTSSCRYCSHAQRYTRMQIHMYTYACKQSSTRACEHAHANTLRHARRHTHTHAATNAPTHTYAHAPKGARAHTEARVRARVRRARAHIRVLAYAHTKNAQTDAPIRAQEPPTHGNTQAHTHARIPLGVKLTLLYGSSRRRRPA